MLRPRSNSPASAKLRRRAKLAARWMLVPVVLCAALGMLWLFPREEVTRVQALEQKNDPVATDYLRGLLKQHPDDTEVRSELVERALRAGDTVLAQDLLAPLMQTGNGYRVRAMKHLADILESRLDQNQTDTPDYLRTQIELRNALISLLTPETLADINPEWLLAQTGRHLPGHLPALYQMLAGSANGRAPYWLERAAKNALASGHYREAATAYFQAQQASRDPAHRKHYFLEGLKTLQSGQLLQDALAIAKRQEADWQNDRDVMLYLVRLSRAAGDNVAAERYVRRLLQLTLLEQAGPSPQKANWQPGSQLTQREVNRLPTAPFDDEIYTLAYDVFVSNQKLDDAMAVAIVALQQLPSRPDWIRRLAQAAEWNQQPAEALAAWRELATRFNDEKGWEGIARLAPSLLADEDMLLIWQRQAAHRTLDLKELREIQSIYERLARPLEGAAFFEKQFASQPQPQLLEQAAYLRQSMGDIEGTLANYKLLARTYGPRPKWALIEASILYAMNAQQEALNALKAAEPTATVQDAGFWRILGDLAWNLDQHDTALNAYRQRQQAEDWQRTDMDRLLNLLEPEQTEERLTVSRAAWKKTGNINYLTVVLGILLERQQTAATRELLASMTAEQQQEASQSSDFLTLRARYHIMAGKRGQAIADLNYAHRLSPLPELKASLIWMLIDGRDATALHDVLLQWASFAGQDVELATAVAAGWQALGNTERALFWSRQLLAGHERDPAWLVDYADLIEQSGQADMAWRIRRHAWLKLRGEKPVDIDALQRQLRLALAMEPVDAGEKRLYQAVIAGTSALPGSATPIQDAALINELAYAWHLGQDDDSRARFWYWRRYAQKLADPAYLALRAASLREDHTTQQKLLKDGVVAIQPADHVVAAVETGAHRLAQSHAWQAMEGSPANDDLHTQMQDLILASPTNQTGLHSKYQSGELSGWRHTLSNQLVLSGSNSLNLEIAAAPQQQYFSHTQNSRDVILSLSSQKETGNSLKLAAGQHWGKDIYRSLALSGEDGFGNWQFSWVAGWNTPVNDNTVLSLAGMQRELSLATTYKFRQNIDSRLRVSRAWILGQDNESLGSRKQLDLSLNWNSPDKGGYSLSLYGQRANYRPESDKVLPTYADLVPDADRLPRAADLLPQSYGRIGLTVGHGLAYQEGYTRAWQPFWSATLGHQTVSKMETAWQLGIAGSLFGNDHLAIYGGRSLLKSGGNNSFGGIFYRWFH